MFRKLSAAIVSGLLISLLVCIIIVFAAPDSILVNESFDGFSEGVWAGDGTASWTADRGTSSNNQISVETFEGSKSLKLYHTGITTGSRVEVKRLKAVSLPDSAPKNIVLEQRFYTTDETTVKYPFYLTSQGAIVLKMQSGILKAYDGTSLKDVQTYAKKTWYDIKVVIHTDGDKTTPDNYDIFIDGIYKTTYKLYANIDRTKDIDVVVNREMGASTTGSTVTTYADNFKVYLATAPGIAASSVTDGQINVGITGDITIGFDKNLDVQTVNSTNIIFTKADGTPINFSLTNILDIDARISGVKLIYRQLEYGTDYRLRLTTGIRANNIPMSSEYVINFQTISLSNLTKIISTSLASNPAYNVPVTTSGVEINFSKAMNSNTINANNIVVTRGNNEVVSYTVTMPTAQKCVINFVGQLDYVAAYKILIKAGVCGSDGLPMENDHIIEFGTQESAGNILAPLVLNTMPDTVSGVVNNLPMTTNKLTVYFNKPMDISTLSQSNILLYNRDEPLIYTQYEKGLEHFTVCLPTDHPQAMASYKLVLSNVKCFSGLSLTGFNQFTFNMPTPPKIVSSSPANGAKNVPLATTSVSVTFDVPLDETTLTQSNVMFMKNNVAVAYTGSYNAATYTYTLTPQEALEYFGPYKIVFSTNVKHLEGIAIQVPQTVYFSTVEYTFTDNYNDRPLGKYNFYAANPSYSGSVAYGQHTIIVQTDPDNALNKIVQITHNGYSPVPMNSSDNGNVAGMWLNNISLPKVCAVEEKVKLDNTMSKAEVLLYGTSETSEPINGTVYFEGNKIYAYNGKSNPTILQDYVADKWYTVKVVLYTDFNADTNDYYDVYIDDVKKASQYLMTVNLDSPIKKLYTRRLFFEKPATMYLDDLKIYQPIKSEIDEIKLSDGTPVMNRLDVARLPGDINVTFVNNMDGTTLNNSNIFLTKASGAAVDMSVAQNGSKGCVLHINESLKYATKYNLTISSGVKDTDGNGCAEKVIEFSTASYPLKVTVPTLMDINGNSISSISGQGFVRLNTEVKNIDAQSTNVALIVVLYKNNIMMNSIYVEKAIKAVETEKLSAGLSIPQSAAGYSIKAFVWDGVHSVRPIILPQTFH